METLTALLSLQIAHLLAVISPGPSLLVVARTSAARSRTNGALVAFGLGLGTLIWSLSALFGLTLVFTVIPWIYTALKMLGAGYLVYIGIMLWHGAGQPLALQDHAIQETVPRPLQSLRLGLLTQLSNPKVAIFFGSIFVTLLPSQPSPTIYAAVIAIVVTNEIGWYAFVAHAFSVRPIRQGYNRLKSWIDRVTGTFLALLGLRLALDTRFI